MSVHEALVKIIMAMRDLQEAERMAKALMHQKANAAQKRAVAHALVSTKRRIEEALEGLDMEG